MCFLYFFHNSFDIREKNERKFEKTLDKFLYIAYNGCI